MGLGVSACFPCTMIVSVMVEDFYPNTERVDLQVFPEYAGGPLVNLRKFNIQCIKWCTMHTLNLGLLMGLNGGALMLCCKTSPQCNRGTQSICAIRLRKGVLKR